MEKGEKIALFVSGIIFALIMAFILLERWIDIGQAIQIIITFVLVCVTALYVKKTAEIAKATEAQAKASVIMAEEMRQARYDTIKPIIDIDKNTIDNTDRANQIIAAREGKTDICIGCTLRNIGLGPAIDVHSRTKYSSGEIIRQDHNTLIIGAETYTILLIEHLNNSMELAVYYRDTYGRTLKSRRPVTLNLKEERFSLGNLEIQEIIKDELHD